MSSILPPFDPYLQGPGQSKLLHNTMVVAAYVAMIYLAAMAVTYIVDCLPFLDSTLTAHPLST